MGYGNFIGNCVAVGSPNAKKGSLLDPSTLDYQNTVIADGGVVTSTSITDGLIKLLKRQGLYSNLKFGIEAEAGIKTRTSGAELFVKKAYSLDSVPNDATQTTEVNQPYLAGRIAPSEKLAFKNPNGGTKYLTHPTISFAANEEWSVSTVLNWYDNNLTTSYYAGYSGQGTGLAVKTSGIYVFRFRNQLGGGVDYSQSTKKIIGVNTIVTFVSDGLGNLTLYVDGLFSESKIIDTTALFDRITQIGIANTYYYGSIPQHLIFDKALTPSQITALYNYNRNLRAEIETIQIGTQHWATSNCEMVATPMGNPIANVTANSAVEKVTNVDDREFNSDTGWWFKNSGWSINAGVSVATNAPTGSYLQRTGLCTAGKWYKVVYSCVSYTSGEFGIIINGSVIIQRSSAGTFTDYICAGFSNQNFGLRSNGSLYAEFDNVSVQEIGWADSQELYDGIYAQTSGTDEEKTYAAVKAAAMWSYYNNDAELGAVYGKLYNWFAVKFLQMDIDYYNAANPGNEWGYRVSTETDFNTLATTLGGASVAGGKMKKEGLTHWNSPNTGATNESGFSAIGNGFRFFDTGAFGFNKGSSQKWTITKDVNPLYSRFCFISNNSPSMNLGSKQNPEGKGLRLIKS